MGGEERIDEFLNKKLGNERAKNKWVVGRGGKYYKKELKARRSITLTAIQLTRRGGAIFSTFSKMQWASQLMELRIDKCGGAIFNGVSFQNMMGLTADGITKERWAPLLDFLTRIFMIP